MRAITYVFFFLFTLTNVFGQTTEPVSINPQSQSHIIGDATLSFSPNYLINPPYRNQFSGGLKMRMFIGKKISLDSELVIGKHCSHFGPGLLGIPILYITTNYFGSGSDDDFGDNDNGSSITELLIMGALVLSSLEHISYHYPASYRTDISPYVSLLRLSQASNYTLETYPEVTGSSLGGAVGVEMNIYLNRFVLSPYAEYTYNYKDKTSGTGFGVYFGYYFLSRAD